MKRILVAGGGGFIGSHLCEKLLQSGHKVTCLDNFVSGAKENIHSFKDNKNFSLVEYDTRTVKENILDGDVDEIYDLASPASVTFISDYPIEAATANSIGTKNLLDIAQKFNAKFLFASSSEVYGDPKVHPQPESYWGNVNPIGVRSGYDEGKRFGEALTMAYQRQFRLETRIVRIFNTYGPRSRIDDSRVVPTFVTKALRNQPLTVHGDGKQTRSFCYVSDMVSGLIALMDGTAVNPINIGNPQEFTVLDLAKKVIEITDSSSNIVFVNRPEDDPSQRKPDITLAREKLGWEPKVQLVEGLQQTIGYFKRIL